MNKKFSLLLVIALVFISGFMGVVNTEAAITTITVTSPNIAVSWSGVHNITWTSDGVIGDAVDIYRCVGGDCSLNQTLISAGQANDGTYSWDTAGLNETDKIMVRDAVSPFAFDASDVNFTVDNTPPTLAVTLSDYTLKVGDLPTVIFTFSEAPTGFASEDVTVGDGSIGAVSATGDPLVFNATLTPTDNLEDAVNIVTVATTWTDAAGNAPVAVSDSPNYVIDTKEPTVAVTSDDYALLAGEDATVTFTFSEEPTGFNGTDVWYDAGTLGAVTVTGNPLIYEGTFTPAVATIDLTNIFRADVGWTDAAGNAPIAVSDSANYTVNTVRPTVAITMSDYAVKAGDTPTVTFTFSEAPTDFAAADVTTPNGSIGVIDSSNPLIQTAVFTPNTVTDSSNLVSVGTSWSNAAGNAPSGATDSSNYAIDTVLPTVGIVVADTALKAGETSLVTFTFSEIAPDTFFDNTDLTIGNGTLTAVSSANGGLTYTATLTPDADVESGTNVVNIGFAWVDAAGNMPSGATDSNNYAIDTVRPTVAITMSDYAVKAGDTPTVTFTFSEAPTGFTGADVTIPNGSIGAIDAGDPLVQTAVFTPDLIDDEENVISVGTDWTDAAGNAPSGATDSSNYAIDTVLPTVGIVVADTALKAGETSLVTFTFSEIAPDTFFDNTDLTIGNGTLTAVSSANGGLTYTATLTPDADVESGTNVVNIGFAWVDAAGNMPSGATDSNNYAIDTLVPTFTVAGVSRNALGDTVALTFSEEMNPATLDVDSLLGITSVTDSLGGALTLTNATGVWSGGNTVYTITLNEGTDNAYIRNTATETVVLAGTVLDLNGNPVSTSGVASVAVAKEGTSPVITVTASSVDAGGDVITITSNEVLATTTALTKSNWTVQYDDNGSGLNIQTLSLANAGIVINAAKTVVTITLDEVTDGSAIPSSKFVKVTPNTNITDLVGNNAVAADYTDVGVLSESTVPTISAVSVADGATGVAVGSTIIITLSEALNQNTVNNNTVKLYTDVGNNNAVDIGTDTEVAATISLENNGASTKIYINPNSDLSSSGNYIYRISTGVKDLSGNAIAANADYDFTTAAAAVGSFAVGNPSMILMTGSADNTYTNGWEWKVRVTLPTDQNDFALKFNNWTSGSNTLAAASNMTYYSEQIAAGTGSAGTPVSIATAGTFPSNVTVSTDADPTTDGIQTDVHIKVKLPASTVAGSYSTSYWVNYE